MVEQEDMSSNKRSKTQQSRMVAGVSVCQIYEGTSDVQRIVIARGI